MSDNENSRPGLIRAGDPSSGTDRGDSPITIVDSIEEAPSESSHYGVLKYPTILEVRNSNGSLRRMLVVSMVGLIGVVVVAGLFAHSWIAVRTGDTTSLDAMIDSFIKTLIPLVTLLVGYVCGKSFHRLDSKDNEQA